MPRKTTFTSDDVIQAAMSVLEADGLASVTARRVADALGASTAPVYSNYANMDELLDAVCSVASDMIVEYTRRPWTEDSFLSMGVGFVHFAIDHPQLFRAMYLDSARSVPSEPKIVAALLDDLGRHPMLGGLPDDHLNELLFQASVYTLGIATTLVTGVWPDPDLAAVESWLCSIGDLLSRAAFESAGMEIPEEMKQRMGEFVVPWRQVPCTKMEDDDDR